MQAESLEEKRQKGAGMIKEIMEGYFYVKLKCWKQFEPISTFLQLASRRRGRMAFHWESHILNVVNCICSVIPQQLLLGVGESEATQVVFLCFINNDCENDSAAPMLWWFNFYKGVRSTWLETRSWGKNDYFQGGELCRQLYNVSPDGAGSFPSLGTFNSSFLLGFPHFLLWSKAHCKRGRSTEVRLYRAAQNCCQRFKGEGWWLHGNGPCEINDNVIYKQDGLMYTVNGKL